jgi:hypothetical protein
MNKKLILLSIIFAILIIISIVLIVSDNKKQVVSNIEIQDNQIEIENNISEDKKIESDSSVAPKTQEEIILFYGVGCPHCEIVDEFIEKNGIEEKVFFSHKEVYYNKDNANILIEKAQICGFDASGIGVPFLWDGKHCFVGDKDIIEFFKLQIGI